MSQSLGRLSDRGRSFINKHVLRTRVAAPARPQAAAPVTPQTAGPGRPQSQVPPRPVGLAVPRGALTDPHAGAYAGQIADTSPEGGLPEWQAAEQLGNDSPERSESEQSSSDSGATATQGGNDSSEKSGSGQSRSDSSAMAPTGNHVAARTIYLDQAGDGSF